MMIHLRENRPIDSQACMPGKSLKKTLYFTNNLCFYEL